jgi:hypothetical protein
MFGKIEGVTLTKNHGNLHKIYTRRAIALLAGILISTELELLKQ